MRTSAFFFLHHVFAIHLLTLSSSVVITMSRCEVDQGQMSGQPSALCRAICVSTTPCRIALADLAFLLDFDGHTFFILPLNVFAHFFQRCISRFRGLARCSTSNASIRLQAASGVEHLNAPR